MLAAVFLVAHAAGPPGIDAASSLDLRFSTSGGYDDDVLARPGDRLAFPIIDDSFYQFLPRASGTGTWRGWEWDLGYEYLYNRYGSEDAGSYDRHAGDVRIGFPLSPSWTGSLKGSTERFRRSEFQDLDQDRLEAEPGLTWQPSLDWALEFSVLAARVHYPDRFVNVTQRTSADSLQTDTPLEVEAAAHWKASEAVLLTGRGTWLRTGSNERISPYDGWRGGMEVEAGLGLGLESRLEASLERRDYNEHTVRRLIRRFPPLFIDDTRRDDSILLAATLRRPINGNVELFTEASYLDYNSNVNTIEFDETRIRGGIEIRFGLGETRSFTDLSLVLKGARRSPFAPVIESGTEGSGHRVVFKCPAAGAASVALVGTFNAWDPDKCPMSDEDKNGVWKASLDLPPGTYRYMFLVDAKTWQRPEGAQSYEDDGFGLENGIIEVR